MRIRMKHVLFFLAVSGLLFPGAGFSADIFTDSDIAGAVDEHLIKDPGVSAHYIDVQCGDGIVTLTGSVPSALSRERAGKCTAAVKGVMGVVNRITVMKSGRTDREIEIEVEDALFDDAAADLFDLTVEVDDAAVFLNGTVNSWQEKNLAVIIARGVRGVIAVNADNVEVQEKEHRTDSEIKNEVEKNLFWDVYIDDALIETVVNRGDVVLTGTVGSTAEKQRAAFKALVAGVKSVDISGLDVKWWKRDERLRGDKYAPKSDTDITNAVERTLEYDPRVSVRSIEVKVSEGHVILSGAVSGLKARLCAAGDARGVVGVTGVVNNLKIRGKTAADLKLQDRTAKALLRDSLVSGFPISVSAYGGEVYLNGTADSLFIRIRAGELAARLKGVRTVHNLIRLAAGSSVQYDPYVDDRDSETFSLESETLLNASGKTDRELARDIRRAFFWSPFVNRDEVTVSVENGKVRLTGEVYSFSEMRTAERLAREAGASVIMNSISVRYSPR